MRLYEDKERAVTALMKEREADRKLSEVLGAMRGWGRVAQEAYSRADNAANTARRQVTMKLPAAEAQFREIEIELTNARDAEERARMLMKSTTQSMGFEVEATAVINQLAERVRRIETLMQELRDLTSLRSDRIALGPRPFSSWCLDPDNQAVAKSMRAVPELSP